MAFRAAIRIWNVDLHAYRIVPRRNALSPYALLRLGTGPLPSTQHGAILARYATDNWLGTPAFLAVL